MRTTLFALAALILLSAGKCREDASGGASSLISLETGSCFGFCPVFKLEVLNNGLARYEGIRFVEKMGRDSFRLTAAELKNLKTKVRETNLWQYPDKIKTEVVDAPFSTLTVYEGGKSKSVNGSIDRPAPLLELEALLRDLAEAHGLQVKRGVNPNDIPTANQRQIILKLKPDVNAGNWVRQTGEIKLQLLRRLSADNVWLVAYDAKQIEEKTLLSLLKDMEGVLDAQADNAVQERN